MQQALDRNELGRALPSAKVDYPVHRPLRVLQRALLLSLGQALALLIYAGVHATFRRSSICPDGMRTVDEIGYVSPSTGAMPLASARNKVWRLAQAWRFGLLGSDGRVKEGQAECSLIGLDAHTPAFGATHPPNIAQEMNRAKV